VVVFWLFFVGMYALLVSLDESGQTVSDRVAGVVVHSLAFLLLLTLVFVILYVLGRGIGALRHLNFFTSDLSTTGPMQPITDGGIVHGVVGTIEQITVALLITIPLGLTCAVFLNEIPGAFARGVRTLVEAMTALPSVIAGLFIFSTYIMLFQGPKSGLAAAFALSIMMLPIIIRAADVVLRLVPGNLREASLALGAGRWRTVWSVVLPTARSGLATAIILGTARGVGETSPVLLTAGYTLATNTNLLSGPQVSLPLLAFKLFQFPQEAMRQRSFGAAATLLVLVLGLFIAARSLGGRAAGELSPRQQRRRAEQSRQDAQRFISHRNGHADSTAVYPSASAGVGALLGRFRPTHLVDPAATPPPRVSATPAEDAPWFTGAGAMPDTEAVLLGSPAAGAEPAAGADPADDDPADVTPRSEDSAESGEKE
jgi:phosphate transport system permease protein